MECKQAQFAMQTALDAAPGGPLPEAVREHHIVCPACRQFWAEQQAIESGLHELAAEDSEAFPDGLHRRIMAALAAEQNHQGSRAARTPARRAFHGRFALGAAASFFIILCAGMLMLRQPGAPSSSQSDHAPVTLSMPELNLAALAPAALLEGPKRDLQELTGSILAVTGILELSQTALEPDPTPST